MGNKPIQELHINYFKFFTDNEPIKINGNHVLLYGENGSGKSSIYWALYTLLEAVSKDTARLDSYFTQGNNSSLLNLNTPNAGDSFVKLTLQNSTAYKIALNDYAIKNQPNAQATLLGSDFINYRFMFKIADFKHGDEIDLFSLFEKEVFPYLKTKTSFNLIHQTKQSSNCNEIWDDLKKGIRKPSPAIQTAIDPQQSEQEYASNLRQFVTYLSTIVGDINIQGNQLLSELGYPLLRIELSCTQAFKKLGGTGQLSGKDSNIPDGLPKIHLTIPSYGGKTIHKPQSFLNEAKWTAIGIAIRFAIVDIRQDYAENADFQLLVLDDLLVSLDMSNRRKVLDLILTKYAKDFQLFVFTHDRAFYEKAKRQISTSGQENEWQYLEMYEDDRNTPTKPFIKKTESYIENAIKHFHQFEFPAAANSLRKACEDLIDKLLPLHYKLTTEGEKIWQLDNLLAKAEAYYKTFPISYQPILEIREYVKVLMNPLSHSDLESPVYRQELKDVFVQFDKLSQYKNLQTKKILDTGEMLYFNLRDNKTTEDLSFEIELLEELSYHFIGNYTKSLGFANFRCFWFKDGVKQLKPIEENDLVKFLKNVGNNTKNPSLDVWDTLSKQDGSKLIDLI